MDFSSQPELLAQAKAELASLDSEIASLNSEILALTRRRDEACWRRQNTLARFSVLETSREEVHFAGKKL
jgi:hypothetical protein